MFSQFRMTPLMVHFNKSTYAEMIFHHLVNLSVIIQISKLRLNSEVRSGFGLRIHIFASKSVNILYGNTKIKDGLLFVRVSCAT